MANTKTNFSSSTIRKRTRRNTIIWVAAISAIVIALLYAEQIAMLYVLATLSVTALLVVVARANFGEAKRATESVSFDDSAAIADKVAGANVVAATPDTRRIPLRR